LSTLAIHAATLLAVLAGGAWSVWTHHRLRARLRRLLWAYAHDPLTGLPTRGYAEQIFQQRAAAGRPTILAMLDLNRFKQVNDAHGHHAGDQLLTAVAGRLVHAAHRHGGHAARLGGDEFLLLLPAPPPGAYPEPVGSILAELATPVPISLERTIVLIPTATAGVSCFNGSNGSWAQLLRQADIALYQARAHDYDYETYRPSMRMPEPPHPDRYGPRLRDQRPGGLR
jgi:diguanylate cyclase (GGDEF)-like protein